MSDITNKIQRPQRWDSPFGEMSKEQVEEILSSETFSRMDRSRFPKNLPLEEIIRNDCRVVNYYDNQIIVRSGDYGSSAFLILKGDVRVILPPGLPEEWLGRKKIKGKNIFKSIAQIWKNPKQPEVRNIKRYDPGSPLRQIGAGGETRIFLQDIPRIIKDKQSVVLKTGDMFGEMAALSRSQRVATVIAEDEVELLEIRWTALRDIRRSIDEFRHHLDRLYRERSLTSHLRATDLFSHLSEDVLTDIAERTLFESHGEFEWYKQYKRAVKSGTTNQIEHEPAIVSEGDYPDGLLLIRSGFARIVKRFNNGYKTLSYIGRGEIFGLEEIIESYQGKNTVPHKTGLRALGYTDVLRVPTSVIEKYVLPNLPEEVQGTYSLTAKPHESSLPPAQVKSKDTISPGLLEFFVENRYINGTATMLIDLDLCVRCDECVIACARGHDNNPRFNRHGPKYDHYMVANACMHCSDPVCMIGCPTGAIHRSSSDGSVIINDDTCIGCSTCANSCPYNNIRMVPIRNEAGEYLLDQDTNVPISKATKCDLCANQPGGPACQRACPHDALTRVDMRDLSKLTDWINK